MGDTRGGTQRALTKEGKNKKEKNSPSSGAGSDPQKTWFDAEFWPGYWRKVGRPAALKMFRKKATSETLKNEIVAAVAAQTPEQMSREVRYRPHAATWLNTDAAGVLRYQVVRKYGKKFSQRRPNGSGGWSWSLEGTSPVPYGLPAFAAAPIVFIVEGEKDAINLSRLGVVATCNNGGAGNFKPELAQYFTGKEVIILPDFDDPGRRHALEVAAILSPVAASVKIIELPGLSLKGDVSDFIAAGGAVDQIQELNATADMWTPVGKYATTFTESGNDKYIHTIGREVELAGGLSEFWNLAARQGIATPWPKLRRALGGGLRKGEVYVLGGNTGTGKTSMALQFAIETMRRSLGVLYFSMEMGASEVFQRMASIESRMDLLEFRDLQLMAVVSIDLGPMKERLIEATRELTRYRLTVSTKSAVTPEFLMEETLRLGDKSSIDLVVIDHMQLMGTTGSSRGDYEKFTAISRMTKEVAVRADVPVLLISQTSRNNASDKRSELEPSDLRGCAAIEEDTAAVLLVYPDREDQERSHWRTKGESLCYNGCMAGSR